MNRNRTERPERGATSEAKSEFIRLRDREHKGDKKDKLNLIIKNGESVEKQNDGKAWWGNYLKNYKNHDYDPK